MNADFHRFISAFICVYPCPIFEGDDIKTVLDNLHVFKEVVMFEPEHYGWVSDE